MTAERAADHRRDDLRQQVPRVRQAHRHAAVGGDAPGGRQRDAVHVHGEREAVHRHRLRRRQERRAERRDVRGVCAAVNAGYNPVMKTRPLILSLALAAACTEPATLQQAFYEGTITERWTVVDTFQDTRTTTLTVRAQPNDPAPTCASSVRVTLSDSTMIAWSDARHHASATPSWYRRGGCACRRPVIRGTVPHADTVRRPSRSCVRPASPVGWRPGWALEVVGGPGCAVSSTG